MQDDSKLRFVTAGVPANARFTMPDGAVKSRNITEVGNSAFRGSGLSGAIWSQSIKTIGATAFSQTKITAFYDKYRWDPNPRPTLLNSIGNGAFSNCTLLKTVELSDSLRTIGQSAFQGSAINSISLSGPTTIGWRAFAFTNVRTAELGKPGSYINLGANAFEGCTSLEYAYICCDEDNQFYAQGPFVDENSDAHIYFGARNLEYHRVGFYDKALGLLILGRNGIVATGIYKGIGLIQDILAEFQSQYNAWK